MPLYNLARVTTPTVGTGTLALGAPVQSFLSFAQAGAQDGDTITYALEAVIGNAGAREVGRGIYNDGATPTLTRNVLRSTNNNNPLNLPGGTQQQVAIAAAAEDFGGVIVAPAAPTGVAANALWLNSTNGILYLWYHDGTTEQWIAVSGPAGPQGPVGLQGVIGPVGPTGPPSFSDANSDGALWARRNGAWERVAVHPDANADGALWARRNGAWQRVPIDTDPPVDGAYLRRNGAWIPLTHASAALTSDIALAPAHAFIDGPSIDVGTVGTWFVTGTITFGNPNGAFGIIGRLWDRTTIIADASMTMGAAGWSGCVAMSGIITNPVAPLRVSAAGLGSPEGIMLADYMRIPLVPDTTRQTHITAMRIG
ncbi:MAG: hypothetical protein C5B60_07395 [Chloroflexi bacterium]|nr:MAG: hypothetical protein C5B60_07395 [Chloroflexota bacterium]